MTCNVSNSKMASHVGIGFECHPRSRPHHTVPECLLCYSATVGSGTATVKYKGSGVLGRRASRITAHCSGLHSGCSLPAPSNYPACQVPHVADRSQGLAYFCSRLADWAIISTGPLQAKCNIQMLLQPQHSLTRRDVFAGPPQPLHLSCHVDAGCARLAATGYGQ